MDYKLTQVGIVVDCEGDLERWLEMEIRKVYRVEGNSGEWSDAYHWTVKAFTNKEKAEQFVDKLNAIANAIFQRSRNLKNSKFSCYRFRELAGSFFLKPLDPNFSMDYTGTTYCMEELEVD